MRVAAVLIGVAVLLLVVVGMLVTDLAMSVSIVVDAIRGEAEWWAAGAFVAIILLFWGWLFWRGLRQ